MFCAQCGIAINSNDKFCAKCGTTVSSAHDESTEQPKPTPAAERIASSATSNVETGKLGAMSENKELNMSRHNPLPYEWGSVVMWVLFLFLWGAGMARPATNGIARIMSGFMLAVMGGLVIAVVKHYKRTPKPDLNTALSSAETNDGTIFFGTLALSVFFIGRAIFYERYGALLDAVILVALGISVKKGFGFAPWLLAAYAFIGTILVVTFGLGYTIIYPIIFYMSLPLNNSS